jgi:hypothetical protein
VQVRLEEAADSNSTLQGYYSINSVKQPEEIEKEAGEEREPKDREKRHPVR